MNWMGSYVLSGYVLYGVLLVLMIVTGDLVGIVVAIATLALNSIFAVARWRARDHR
ncbi:MAG: hypothetical protein JWQ20_2624 [Conexibacter sp.]|nr:hypothetical protein [Conexibacter sp.]